MTEINPNSFLDLINIIQNHSNRRKFTRKFYLLFILILQRKYFTKGIYYQSKRGQGGLFMHLIVLRSAQPRESR